MTIKTAMLAVLVPVGSLAAAAAPDMTPGLWRNTVVVGGEKPTVTTECRGAHPLELPPVGGNGCTAVRNVMANGVIDIVRSCQGRTVSAVGRYTPTSMALRLTGVQFIPGRSTTLQINAVRVGACDPS